MDKNISQAAHDQKTIIRRCHCCGMVIESKVEISKCPQCKKNFLPINYFFLDKKALKNDEDLYATSGELNEEDLIKGLFVLW